MLKANLAAVLITMLCMAVVLSSCVGADVEGDEASSSGTVQNGEVWTDIGEGGEEDIQASLPIADIRYVALGDSIARGYGLEDPEKERYSTLVSDMIKANGIGCTVHNYAVDGMRSDELIEQIVSGRTPELENASVITVSIGANNVLSKAIDFFHRYFANMYMIASDKQSELTSEQIAQSFNEFIADAQAGITQLREDIPKIVAAIRRENPSALILWQTVYNPYADADLSIDIGGIEMSLDVMADTQVSAINTVILENAGLGYVVADIYSAFEESPAVSVNAGAGGYDPHPSADGHRIIANMVYSLLINGTS